MPSRRLVRHRRAFTMIELAIVCGVVAILAAIALPNINFARWRMDGAAGTVQNNIVAAQAQTVQHNYPYILTFCWKLAQYRMVGDANSNGRLNIGESVNWRTLPDYMKFVIPPTTIDGASPYYATGPGLTFVSGGGCGGSSPTLTLYPNGSSSGDIVVYLGSGKTARKEDYRAIQIYGSTSKVYLWRMMSDGTWKQASQ
jgi:prepilin-type N-terminal cleavage/methylation domain-containing protein